MADSIFIDGVSVLTGEREIAVQDDDSAYSLVSFFSTKSVDDQVNDQYGYSSSVNRQCQFECSAYLW